MNRQFFIIMLIFFATTSVVWAEDNLWRTLKVGDRGQDVRFLQQLLNKDPETAVATSGLGSLGNESTYFGLKTKEAVARFQEKYASSTLFPLGLSQGTGNFGKLTLNFMAQFFGISTSTPVATTSLSSVINLITQFSQNNSAAAPLPPSIINPGKPLPTSIGKPQLLVGLNQTGQQVQLNRSMISLIKLEPKEGNSGTSVTVYGDGFSTTSPTKVYVGGELKLVTSRDGKTLTVNVSTPTFGGVNNTIATSVPSVSGLASAGNRLYQVNNAQIVINGNNITYTAVKQNGRTVSGSLNGLSLNFGSGLKLPIGIYVLDSNGNPSNGLTFSLQY